jgi:hypothetical protein
MYVREFVVLGGTEVGENVLVGDCVAGLGKIMAIFATQMKG